MAQDLLGRSARHDGLQVAGGDDREEKYPAVLIDAPKFSIGTDNNALCLTSVEGSQKQPCTTCGLVVNAEPARLGTRLRKGNVFILVALASSIIIGSCVGGVLGSRRAGSTSTSKPYGLLSRRHPIELTIHNRRTSTRTSAAPTASPTLSFHDSDRNKALSGTSFASATYPYSTDYNYVVLYQHANGDIRKCVYNGTGWHKAMFVTDDARLGTGLTTAWTNAPSGPLLRLYYIDKANKLQELRGTHASDTWTRGTLGNFNFQTATNHSALSMQFSGYCQTGRNAFLFYQTSDGAIRQVWWNSEEDKWSAGTNFTDMEPQSGFVTFLSNETVWRVFMMSTRSRVVQYICIDCCERVEWEQGRKSLVPII